LDGIQQHGIGGRAREAQVRRRCRYGRALRRGARQARRGLPAARRARAASGRGGPRLRSVGKENGAAMSANDRIEGLIKAGAAIKTAWTSARQRDPELDRVGFLGSAEFNTAYAQLSGILNGLTQPAVTKALTEIRAKELALLGGMSVMELPTEKLSQY